MENMYGLESTQNHLPCAHERNRHFALAIDPIGIVLVMSSALVGGYCRRQGSQTLVPEGWLLLVLRLVRDDSIAL